MTICSIPFTRKRLTAWLSGQRRGGQGLYHFRTISGNALLIRAAEPPPAGDGVGRQSSMPLIMLKVPFFLVASS